MAEKLNYSIDDLNDIDKVFWTEWHNEVNCNQTSYRMAYLLMNIHLDNGDKSTIQNDFVYTDKQEVYDFYKAIIDIHGKKNKKIKKEFDYLLSLNYLLSKAPPDFDEEIVMIRDRFLDELIQIFQENEINEILYT